MNEERKPSEMEAAESVSGAATQTAASGEKKRQNILRGFFDAIDLNAFELSLENLFRSGVHFGHKKSRRHPDMGSYVYTTRDGVSILDLKKTQDCLEEALSYMRELSRDGKQVLFVGTKKHLRDLVESAAVRCSSPFVSERWLGGTFTNFASIHRRVEYMKEIEEKIASGAFKELTKLERMKKGEEVQKLQRRMNGLRNLGELPAAVFVLDVKEDDLAIREARRVGVPVVAIVDTNDDPKGVDYPIPANNDAISSLKYVLGLVCRTITEGKGEKKTVVKSENTNEAVNKEVKR